MARVRPNGGVLGPPITVSGTSASGMFSIVEANLDKQAGNFPVYIPVATTEPQFNLTTLLLHGDGSNAANNNTFLDSSTNAFTLTRTGTPTQGTFSPFSQTGWSNYFGASNYLTVASNAAFSFGTGDFTIEFWLFPTASFSTTRIMSTYTGGIAIYPNNSGNILVDVYGVTTRVTTTSTVSINTWTHIAVVRSSGTTTVYLNGVSGGSGADATSYTNSGLYIGTDNGTNSYTGYISNFRIVKGTAVYTTNFTPSTTPLTAITNTQLLTCQSNRFLDNSTNAFTITISGTPAIVPFSPFAPAAAYGVSTNGGSVYFNGSTDYITAPMNTAITGDFTAECWFYVTAAAAAYNGIFGKRTSGATYSPFLLGTSAGASGTTMAILLSTTGSSWNINTTAGVVTFNQWNHVALVRSGSTVTCYLNGTSIYSGTLSGTLYNPADAFSVGALAANGYGPFNGYISNARLVIGTAVYTSAFTPPTAPVTAITNTQLLVNGTNAGVYDSTAKNDLITAGTVQISTAQSKFGGSSMYFATSGDGLTIPANNLLSTFGAGNFTIEFWIRYTSAGAQIADLIRSTTWAIVDYSNGNLYWQNAYASSSLLYYNHGSLQDGNWHHVAVVRSATSTLTMYVDGTSIGSGTDTNVYNTNSAITIGISGSYGQFLGYMDDIRITRYARYTSTFTPTTSSFLNQ